MIRPRYPERSTLRRSDLEREQRYRIAARQRHNLAGHGWGIVCGLEIVLPPTGPVVQAGMAIDGYGRELIVPEPIAIPGDATFAQLGPDVDVVDVWLVSHGERVVASQGGGAPGGPRVGWREQARLRVQASTAGRPIDPRRPWSPGVGADGPGLHELTPGDPRAVWPVFLGRVARTAGPLVRYEELPLALPYVILRGERIVSPPGRRKPRTQGNQPISTGAAQAGAAVAPEGVRMQLGAELEADRRRFAVALPDAAGAFVDRLAIIRGGGVELGGPATLRGRLTLGGAVLRPEEILDPFGLDEALVAGRDPVSRYIAEYTGAGISTWADIRQRHKTPFWPRAGLQRALCARLNSLLEEAAFYDKQRFAYVSLRLDDAAIGQWLQGRFITPLNRLLLEDAYPDFIARRTDAPDGNAAIVFGALSEAPTAAAPRQVYRATSSVKGIEHSALRIEIANPGQQGDPASNLFVIGSGSDGVFSSGLTVAASGSVTVNNIRVVGQIVEQPIDANLDDPRFGARLAEGIEKGISVPHDLGITIKLKPPSNATPTEMIKVGAKLEYSVELKNNTASELADIEVYAHHTIASVVVLAWELLPQPPLSIPAGESKELTVTRLSATVPNDPGHAIELLLTVRGKQASGKSVIGSTSHTARIVA